ncbi:MAG: hypothetical protein LBV69_09215 [Bacteroidales bacterium]|jgi:hypothetical protein|nr:hypothetical protein [Bacteroidales bacterium]
MILIASCEFDVSAKKIIDLCEYKKIPYFYIENSHIVTIDDVEIINGELKNFSINNISTNKIIFQEEISGFFYRKGRLIPDINLDFFSNVDNDTKQNFFYTLNNDFNTLVEFIFRWIEHNVHSIGSYINIVPNKLQMLQIASECGLEVPDSYIFSDLSKTKIFKKNKNYICKSIQQILSFINNDYLFATYASKFQKSDKHKNEYRLFPSLIQQKINSHYEIRCFFFYNHIYNIAILHNKNKSRYVDYRAVENIETVPFIFNKTQEKKVKNFIAKSVYNSGSIDFLLSEQEELFFLEINPVGQFDFVSDFCGKNIEIDIINYLSKH